MAMLAKANSSARSSSSSSSSNNNSNTNSSSNSSSNINSNSNSSNSNYVRAARASARKVPELRAGSGYAKAATPKLIAVKRVRNTSNSAVALFRHG